MPLGPELYVEGRFALCDLSEPEVNAGSSLSGAQVVHNTSGAPRHPSEEKGKKETVRISGWGGNGVSGNPTPLFISLG